jgi:outer membrane protein TolC
MDIVWQEWQFAQTARQAVYDLAALENQLQVLTASQNGLEENLKIVEKAVDEGNLTLVELSAAESAAIASRANTLAARQQLQQQRVTLNRSLGRPPEAPVSVNPSIEFPDKLELPSDQELLAISEGRADVDAIRRSYESQEETLRAAIAAQIPTTSLILTRASDTSEVGTLGAGISIDLQWFDRNQGAIATETAQRNKVHDQYVQQVFLARSEVGSALVDIRWLEEQIATVQQAIPVFQKLVDTYDKAVKEKNANAVVYYLAFNDLIQQQLELWRLRRQLIDARIALETAVGFPIDN